MSAHLDYEINKELGECYLFMGELDKAESYYRKAAGSNGVHPDPYIGLATIAVQRGDLKEAASFYEQAEALTSSDKSLAGLGLIAMQEEEHEKAFTLYHAALGINPENMVALFGLIQSSHVLGRTAEAVEPLSQYLELTPDKHDIRYALAGCLVASGQNEAARIELEKIVLQEPGHSAAMELLSQI